MTTASDPIIDIAGLTKIYPADAPLRIARLEVRPGAALVVEGFDVGAAEVFMHLVTGAAVPDEGYVRIAGRDTRAIATDTEWLRSLDVFGLVSARAVLLGSLSAAANLALPMTLAIDPMTEETRALVDAIAREVGLTTAALDGKADALGQADRLRLHLARALASGPRVLLLEHPTTPLADEVERAAFGRTLRSVVQARGLTWVAVSNDRVFAKATEGTHLRLDATTGRIGPRSWWERLTT